MNTRNRNLFIIFCFFVLMTGCSNQASIQSATADKVVIKAQPESFVEAYEIARKECEKNEKTARYITDESADLGIVAFDCFGQEVETQAEADAETETDVTSETEVDVEMQPQTESATTEPDTEIQTDMAAETEMQMEMDAETQPQTEAEPALETEVDSKTGMEMEMQIEENSSGGN